MKKIIAIMIVAAMLLAVPITAQAASASLSGPDVIRAGDTITLTFRAGGGIVGCRGVLKYESSQLQLQSITPAIGGAWKVDISGNIIMATDETLENPLTGTSAICNITFKVLDLAPGTTVSVSIGVTLTTTELTEAYAGGSWTKTVSEPLSDNANLQSLEVSNATITPAFNPNTTEYTASVPFETNKLQVSATAEHSGAKVTVGSTALAENATTDVQVTVTAEDGTQKVYHIRVTRPRDPNYVESSVNTLKELGVEDFFISPGFTPERQAYAVYLPYEVDSLKLTAKTTDSKAKVKLPSARNIPVGESTYEIPVTAENGKVRTYTLTVYRAEPFLPDEEIQETEPVTEPTTEPTEATTVPTTQATEPAPTQPEQLQQPQQPEINLVVAVFCMVISFLCGILIPMLLRRKKK